MTVVTAAASSGLAGLCSLVKGPLANNAIDGLRHPVVIRPWKLVRRMADRVLNIKPREHAPPKKRGT
jgi:hypothetical protein